MDRPGTSDRAKTMSACCAALVCLCLALGFGAGKASAAKVPRPRSAAGGQALQARLALGKRLYDKDCASCHTIGGDNDIRKATANVSTVGVEAYITGQGRIFDHMPLFEGSKRDRRAIAEYITIVINQRTPDDETRVRVRPRPPVKIPHFDPATAQYVLLAWNTLGMKCITDADKYFSFLPPGNAFGAVLIRRGPKPQFVTSGVELTYAVEPGFSNPSAHVDFWKYAPSLVNKRLPPNVSAAGKGLSGLLAYNPKSHLFGVAGVPVVPFSDDGVVNPYPLFTITAKDSTGTTLAQTKLVAPVDSEIGCRSCHGGPWRRNGVIGISDQTAHNILAVHDRRSGTKLLAQAEAGKPVLCQSCHPDPLLNAKGDPARLNLPAALHGFHANYLTGRGEEVCSRCHPDSPTGFTRCLRGNHQRYGIGCVRCHGLLEDHALSLLKGEEARGNARAEKFMRYLKPRLVSGVAAIKPRKPWLQEPDCSGCHKDGRKPDLKKSMAFNTWTADSAELYRSQKDAMGAVPCIACHGAPHAGYPAKNPFGKNRDNIQPLQYQKLAAAIGARGNCLLCHTRHIKIDRHHPAGMMPR